MPFNYKPEYIEDKYAAKIFMLPTVGTAQGLFLKRETDHSKEESTKDALFGLAKEL